MLPKNKVTLHKYMCKFLQKYVCNKIFTQIYLQVLPYNLTTVNYLGEKSVPCSLKPSPHTLLFARYESQLAITQKQPWIKTRQTDM